MIPAASRMRIAKATVVALGVALVILFTAVLPAEYGIDPLGTGSMLGLTQLAEAETAVADSSATATATTPPPQARSYTEQSHTYKVDSRKITLVPGEGIEIKYHMNRGAVMVYAWKSTGKVLFEFHGEPDEKPNPDYYDSYEIDDKIGKDQSYGSFTAPSTGIHGWFWENRGEQDAVIQLTTAGFYDSAKQFSAAGQKPLTVSDPK